MMVALLVAEVGVGFAAESDRTDTKKENAHAERTREAQERDDDIARMQLVGERKDIRALDSLMAQLQAKWVLRTPEDYGQVMLAGLYELSSQDVGVAGQHELSRKYAVETLKLADRFSIELEADLVQHVMADLWSGTGPKGDAWAKQRTHDMALWFHAWKRVTDAIDPNWDEVRDAPRAPSPPTKGVDVWMDGMSADAIKDPVERTRFLKESSAAQEKLKTWTAQIDARRLESSFRRRRRSGS